MGLEIFWTREASASYERIGDYIFDSFGLHELKKFQEQVDETLLKISTFPEMFRVVDRKKVRKGRVSKHTVVLYRIHRDGIEVLLFADDRQDHRKLKYE